MLTATETKQRQGRCEDCGATFLAPGKRGTIPKTCPPCNKKRRAAASRAWKERNKEELNARRRATRDAEVANARKRAWHAANKERVREYRRRLYVERQAATAAQKMAEYRKRRPGWHAELEARRRARIKAQFVAPVNFQDIWERDEGICQLCGDPVQIGDHSLDHIVPIARGGTHEPSNVQLAHPRCNSSKGARVTA